MNSMVRGIGMTSQRTRDRLVERLRSEGVRNEAVLEVIRNTPRHLFVDEALSSRAYEDTALPIGLGQTISQPWVVAKMTEARMDGGSPQKVLEVGTGSGYQAAVMAEIVEEVYCVEISQTLADRARHLLVDELGYGNIHVRCGDGYSGWAEEAPFDAILVAAAASHVPDPLIDQLAVGGRMILPVGKFSQTLIQIEKRSDGSVTQRPVAPVAFVPMTGQVEQS